MPSVLVTGGATGIGFALAERFLAAGAKVLICGRRTCSAKRRPASSTSPRASPSYLARVPIYCATQAAMHSFTLSLRHQLAGTSVRVQELHERVLTGRG